MDESHPISDRWNNWKCCRRMGTERFWILDARIDCYKSTNNQRSSKRSFVKTYNSLRQSISWSLANVDPKPQIIAKTNNISWHSFEKSAGRFFGISRQSSKWHVICIIAISDVGVMRLKFLVASMTTGRYLSKSDVNVDRSTKFSRVSTHDATNLFRQIVRCVRIVQWGFRLQILTDTIPSRPH